jgi:thiol-disulfide isomerase/thioredoxin
MVGAALAGVPGCDRSTEARRDPESKPAGSGVTTAAPSPGPLPAMPAVLARGLRFVKAPPGKDVVGIVKKEREDAKGFGRDLVVYVGATWCEPCQRFHKAAQAGTFDDVLPQLTLLEFDLDEDRERLVTAGYVSQFIPLFVVPGDEGKPSSKRFEGGIKGDGAAQHVASRLRAMFER